MISGAPTQAELSEAIERIYSHLERAFRFDWSPRFNVAFSSFAGPLSCTHSISIIARRNDTYSLRAGDGRLDGGEPGARRTWTFDHKPTREEAAATFATYFAELQAVHEKQVTDRDNGLIEFWSRHGRTYSPQLEQCI